MWSHSLGVDLTYVVTQSGGGLKVCGHTVRGVDLRHVVTRSGGWT